MDEAGLDAAAAELLARQVMEEHDAGRLRFLHDKIREVAYERIDPDGRSEVHRAVAQILDALPAPRRDERLAIVCWHDDFLARAFADRRHHDRYRDVESAT